jgi:preprotein translocase subunit SecE
VADGNAVRDTRDSRDGDRARTTPVVFLRQVVAEMRKVVWPTQKELVTYFIVVLVFVVAVMTMVALLDLGFGELMFKIFAGNSTQ